MYLSYISLVENFNWENLIETKEFLNSTEIQLTVEI